MKYLIRMVLGVCCLIASAQEGITQTTFAWPETNADLKGYQYFDNCVAVGGRVADSVRKAIDTAFVPRGTGHRGAPEKVQQSLRECLSAYAPTQIPRDYTVMAHRTYLLAGQFAEAEAAARHGLSQVAATDTAARTALIDSVLERYAKTGPVQFHLVEAWIDTLQRYGAAYRPWNLFRDYYWLMLAAYGEGRDSLAAKAGRRMIELAPAATKSAKAAEVMIVQRGVSGVLRLTRERELLDSLRKGTAAYAELYAAHLRQAMGFVPAGQIRNAEAAVLVGDYWFPTTAAMQEYPRKGRATLLAFVPDRMGETRDPSDLLRTLRRLSQKYPAIDQVLVTSTTGVYGPLEPQSAEREASLADSVFRHFHRLNHVLSVTKGTYVQIDAPDNRRFYQPYPNFDAYPPFGGNGNKMNMIYLIDENRRIVDIISAMESDIATHLLETLLARIAAGQ